MHDTVAESLDRLAQIAENQIGAAESPRGSNRGPALAKFFKADDYEPHGHGGLDHGYPWCAAFVCWVVQEWLRVDPTAAVLFLKLRAPRTAAAYGLIDWARGLFGAVEIIPQIALTAARNRALPRRGDLVVYGFSHCGIVTAGDAEGFTAVEGNTDAGGSREGWIVARRRRRPRDVRALLRFIPIARRVK